ncbi:MAG: hypothetical protein CMK74_04020 [Pseudomonadales bacterium]|nr:hypothetical protein [Pseudomonadales bacterium]|tara:strand:+ start:992 stop:1525 length:534 start_codon:yes stop_codon:yes gene_type:complete
MNPTQTDVISEIPINLNGLLRVKNMPASAAALNKIVERFEQFIAQELVFGESGDCRYQFSGDVWSSEGEASVGDLRIGVKHDPKLNISGASVGLAPQRDEYGANRIRARVTAYVTPDAVYISARDRGVLNERVLCLVNISEGDLTCHVMDPCGADSQCDELSPTVSVRFPDMISALN